MDRIAREGLLAALAGQRDIYGDQARWGMKQAVERCMEIAGDLTEDSEGRISRGKLVDLLLLELEKARKSKRCGEEGAVGRCLQIVRGIEAPEEADAPALIDRGKLLDWLDERIKESWKNRMQQEARVLGEVRDHVDGLPVIIPTAAEPEEEPEESQPAKSPGTTRMKTIIRPGWNIPLKACAVCGAVVSAQGHGRDRDLFCRRCGRQFVGDEKKRRRRNGRQRDL